MLDCLLTGSSDSGAAGEREREATETSGIAVVASEGEDVEVEEACVTRRGPYSRHLLLTRIL